jgi:NADPH:quinone reductase-like Zn-dependent oxidoreductase
MNALTVQLALDSLALKPGQALCITGGTGAVGTAAIQLGKLRGLRVISDVSSSKEDQAWLKSLGADELVLRGEGFLDAVKKLAPTGVPGLIDGALLNGSAFPAIADGGALVTVRGWKEAGPRGIEVKPVMVGTALDRIDLIEALRDHVNRGELTPRVAKIFPAALAADAHRYLEAGGVRGRPVLDLTRFS